VAHADGTYVSRALPARPGETLIVYAFGLGQPDFLVGSGQATPSEVTVSVTGAFTIKIESLNSGSDGVPTPADAIAPSFTGLAPGFVGLYQVNFKVPALAPPSVIPCTESIPYNARISLTGAASSATEQICVSPGG